MSTHNNIDCGYSLEPPQRGGSNEYPQSMFLSRTMKNIRIFIQKFSVFGGKSFNIFEKACFRNVRQNFKGNLTKFCEIFFHITFELP